MNQYWYDLHGIITLTSAVRLPELAYFGVEKLPGKPSIRVCPYNAECPATSRSDSRQFAYHDGVGKFGFWIHLALAETTSIQVSPLLLRSPHVLYTNVVEPILRWMFVERGYVLLHGACFALKKNQNASFLVTARTDTGKTTTILKLLDQHSGLRFLADDLTLLAPDRIVLSYPKPLTISRHTVAAVPDARLNSCETSFLALQSRIHSRGGRRLAQLLSQTRLPMATINTLVQIMVPPPKYGVEHLIPGVEVINRGRLAGIYLIERGLDERVAPLADDDIDGLLAVNTADAFGFPPYEKLEPFLADRRGAALRDRERRLLKAAVAGIPGIRIESSTMDWAARIAHDLAQANVAAS